MALKSPVGGDFGGTLAFDAGALEGLRRQAKTAPREALAKAVGQFEAMFLQMVLKSMREALPQDGALASDTAKSYTSMLDGQLAQKLAERGVGLRQALERQLARNLAGPPEAGPSSPSPSSPSSPASSAGFAVRPPTSEGLPIARDGATPPVQGGLPAARPTIRVMPWGTPVAPTSRGAAAPPPSPVVAPATGSASAPPGADADPARAVTGSAGAAIQAFVDKFRAHAEAAAKAIGVPAQLLLAQAGLETGWGRHQPRTAEGQASHNLFGVKAGSQWNGAVVPAATTEYVQGRAVRTAENFRAYGSYAESFADFARVLRHPRYAAALANSADPQAYASSLQRAGYATDPAYAQKLVRAIELVTARAGVPGTQVLARVTDIDKDRA